MQLCLWKKQVNRWFRCIFLIADDGKIEYTSGNPELADLNIETIYKRIHNAKIKLDETPKQKIVIANDLQDEAWNPNMIFYE